MITPNKALIFLTLFFLIIFPIICASNTTNIVECQEGGLKCNLNNGKCVQGKKNVSECVCSRGYITYPENNEIQCNYHKESQFIAFILEFVFCCGFGLLYIKKYIHFLIKFSFCMLMYYLYQKYSEFKEKNSTFIIIISSVVFLGMLCSHLYDIYNLFNNSYLDGNKISLIHW